ncbi:MAG TPA: hydrogenase maturation protease [Vicinamibacterales bacterium]
MRVLVAGIGNVFLSDDGFGVEVVRRLSSEPLGDGVDVVDFGIRGVHLAFDLADGRYDSAILVDAVAKGGEPGTLYVIDPDFANGSLESTIADAHSLTPDAVLAWIRQIGGTTPRIIVLGCEPGTTEESMELSAPVANAIDLAIEMIRALISEMKVTPQCA